MTAAPPFIAEGGSGLLSVASLLLAFALFAAIVAWVFAVPKARWQRDSEIPLDNDAPAARKKEKSHE